MPTTRTTPSPSHLGPGSRSGRSSGGGVGGGAGLPASELVLPGLAVLAGVAFALLVFGIGTLDRTVILITVTGAVGAAAGVAALMRFEWFVIGLFVARAALDAFSGESAAQIGGLNPAAALGIVFVAIGSLWLFVQWRVGLLVRWSAATRGLFLVAAAGFASVPLNAFREHSAEAAVSVLSCALMFAVVEQLAARQPRFGRYVLVAIFASMVIPAVAGYGQLRSGETEFGKEEFARLSGTFAHPNPFATYLMIVLLLGLALAIGSRRWGRLAGLAVVAASGPLLLFTYARAAWGATLVAVAYLAWRHSRRLLLVLAVAVVGLVFAVPSVLTRLSDLGGEQRFEGVPANSLEWRIGYWFDLIDLASESPIVGVGLDTVQFRTPDALRPHNVFVQTYVETGLVGVAALAFFIIGMATTLRDRRRAATTKLEAVLSAAAVSVAIGLLLQAFTENLGTSTVVWWYAAGAIAVARGWSRAPAPSPVLASGAGRGQAVGPTTALDPMPGAGAPVRRLPTKGGAP